MLSGAVGAVANAGARATGTAARAGASSTSYALSKTATAKEKAKVKLLSMSAGMRSEMLDNLRKMILRSLLADPKMWKCVQRLISGVVNSLWKDVEQEIAESIDAAVLRQIEEQEVNGPDCRCLCCTCKFRTHLLHHYVPHDKTIFGKLADPFFVVISVLTILPLYGIRVAIFTIMLIMHLLPGPPDEYQLINFILTFKGTQFLTSGVIATYFAGLQTFGCYTWFKNDFLNCVDKWGPGAIESSVGELVDYFGNVLLVWAAFLSLPFSKKYGKRVYVVGKTSYSTPSEEVEATYCCCIRGIRTRGGYLRRLLVWDIICFVLSVGLLFFLILTGPQIKSVLGADHQLQANIFWARNFHATLSFPFAVFLIPVLSKLLTHSHATGYNQQGACVTFKLPLTAQDADEKYFEDSDEEKRIHTTGAGPTTMGSRSSE